MNRRELVAGLCLATLTVSAFGEDWPQWLGPRRDGSSTVKIAPWKEEWKVAWRKPVGEGHGSPVVAAGKVYLHTLLPGGDKEALTCYSVDDGRQLWQTGYPRDPKIKILFGNGPRATPAVANGRVFTYGITGVLTCFDAAKGNILWQVDTQKDLGAPRLFFGASCSPLVVEDKVLMNIGGKGSSIVAFAASDGKVLWKNLDDGASYSSPIVVGAGDERQAVFLTAKGLVGAALGDGGQKWRFDFADKLAESSVTPVQVGDRIIGSSITLGTVGLSLVRSGTAVQAMQNWLRPDLTGYFSTPVPVGKDHLYLVTGTKPPALTNQATLHCIEVATGKELWKKAGVGSYHASLLRTGDDRLLLLEEKGDLVLVEPDPKGYREACRLKLCGRTWAHPALAEGRLFIRDGKELSCRDLPGR